MSVGTTGGSFLSRELKSEGNDDARYTSFDLNNGFVSIALKNRYGWDVGLVLEYQLGAKLSLIGSTHFQRNIYSGNGGASALKAIESFEEADELPLGGAGLIEVNGESLNSYTFKQSMITYQLGARYTFRKNKKWRPYLSLSASAISMVKQTLFEDGISNGSYNPVARTKVAESKPINSSFRFTGVVPGAGFQMRLNPKMNWQMETWYRQGFNREKDYLYGLLGLRTGVSYRF